MTPCHGGTTPSGQVDELVAFMKNRKLFFYRSLGDTLKRLGKPALVLIAVLLLLFVSVNINTWIGYPALSSEQLQAIQFAVSLIGIFLGAHYELQNLQRNLKEERRKEVRQQRLNLLDYIDTWLSEVSSASVAYPL